jgi:hypothetical protein
VSRRKAKNLRRGECELKGDQECEKRSSGNRKMAKNVRRVVA